MDNTKQKQLDRLRTKIVQEGVCPELAKAAKNMVFGEGSANASVVFVGEAPGKSEDETGHPFVGAAGKFLDEMLKGIGLDRKDVYITSILKYRPPNNRDPKTEEKNAFWPYLQAQLGIIKPKLVATLGRHSTNCFLPDLQIGKAHGKLQKTDKWTILPLYHPAAALYNNSMRQTLIDDFAQIQRLLKNSITTS